MARLVGPDEGARAVYTIVAGAWKSAAGQTAILYADEAATELADVRTHPGGSEIAGSELTIDSFSRLPLFQYPDGANVVYASVNGGPVVPLPRTRVISDLLIDVSDAPYGVVGDGSDETAGIVAALAAAVPGQRVWFPRPVSYYRVSAAVPVPAGVAVLGAGIGCEIRQSTQLKPVFDVLNADNVLISGFTLTNASGPPPSAGASFRGDSGYAYSAGVWANGNRITVENLRIKDFGMGVYLNASNGTVNGVSPLRVGNRVRNLEISGANHGVLYLMQEDLEIEGIYSHDHVDSSSGVNPVHAIYGTGAVSQRSKNVNVKNCNARNITTPGSSCAYQFKYVDGLTFENLRADNTHGLLNVIDCNDIVADNLQATNTLGTAGAGYAVWFQPVAVNPTRVTLTNLAIQMASANAQVLGIVADDARISNVRVSVQRTSGGAAYYDVILRGNRITLDGYKARNIGAGAGNAIIAGVGASVATSDITISDPELDGFVNVADVDQACTGTNVVEYTLHKQRRITNPVASHCRSTNNGSLGGTVTAFRVVRHTGVGDADAPAVGEFVPRRERISSNAVGIPSGTLALTYWTADKSEAITTLTAFTGTTAAAATPTLCRMGIYSVADNGDITLVAATPNDTALFAATNTAYAKSLSGTFTKVAGVRYATAFLVVSGATMPTFHGIQFPATGPTNTIVRVTPPIIGRVTSQTDLPASVAAASVVGYQAIVAMQLT